MAARRGHGEGSIYERHVGGRLVDLRVDAEERGAFPVSSVGKRLGDDEFSHGREVHLAAEQGSSIGYAICLRVD